MEMKIKKMVIQRFSIVRNRLDICFDYKFPIIFAETESIWKTYRVKIRFIAEIIK